MRRLNLVLLVSLQLCGAHHPGFSIHDDLLAHPQFELVFADDFIFETDALALLESSRTSNPIHASDVPQSDLTSNVRGAPATGSTSHGSGTDAAEDDDAPISETYELINSAPWRYLCSVPVIAPPPTLNQTATELANAEEARELSRASARGWELMSSLDGQCLHFMSGWWSYSFCYGKGVVQFHATVTNNKAGGGSPAKGEITQEYILGRADKTWDPQEPAVAAEGGAANQPKTLPPPNGQLQVKGDQRYLSQRLDDGTLCDRINRPRTIEIQYHCSPGSSPDRIGWIKEVTTCNYLMAVYTPRLCADMAFQPPKPTPAHPIRCRQVISNEDEESAWRYHKRVEAGAALVRPAKGSKTKKPTAGAADQPLTGITIGGVELGARRLLSREAAQTLLPLPRGLVRQAAPALVLASKKAGAGSPVEALSDEQLEQLQLDLDTVREYITLMEEDAGPERGWRLQVEIAADGRREWSGAIDEEGVDAEGLVPGTVVDGLGTVVEDGGGKGKGKGKGGNGGGTGAGTGSGQTKEAVQKGKKAADGAKGAGKEEKVEKVAGKQQQQRQVQHHEEEGDEEGSEEKFFKEEL